MNDNPMSVRNNKGSQWPFIVTSSFISETEKRLSELPLGTLVTFVTCTMCNDDAGNRVLMGFVKLSSRVRVSTVEKMIGENVFYSVPTVTPQSCLLDINLRTTNIVEIGDNRLANFVQDVKEFKHLVCEGSVPLEKMQQKYPYIFRSLRRVIRFVREANPSLLS